MWRTGSARDTACGTSYGKETQGPHGSGTHLAAVVEGTDGGSRVVVPQLLLVGPAEAQGTGKGAGMGIVPGGSVLAVQCEVLAGAGAQETQEGELGHGHSVPVRVHVGELEWGGRQDRG